MKTIGLIGGMSWESSAHYYAILNRETARLRGGLHSAPWCCIRWILRRLKPCSGPATG